MNNKTLLLFTHFYPYGSGEQFLELELQVLSKHFQKIVIIPSFTDNNARHIPVENVAVIKIGTNRFSTKTNYFKVLGIFFNELISSKYRSIYLKKARYYIAYIKNTVLSSEKIYSEIIQKYPGSTCYTYWFTDTTFALSLLKKDSKIQRLITRGHGGDIYEYQHPEKDFIFPFRHFQMKYIDAVYCVSKDGADHVKSDYRAYRQNVHIAYLATEPFKNNRAPANKPFTLLSCSSFYPYKRIPLLINALSHCKSAIHWIHIGDMGDEKQRSEELLMTLPSNISCKWTGFLDKKAMHTFYNSTHVDLFINVSSSEGLPVTLMEAISCGIPVMAANVGGVAEIATSQTGILVDKNISGEALAALIDHVVTGNIKLPGNATITDFWKENFSPDNYENFYKTALCAA